MISRAPKPSRVGKIPEYAIAAPETVKKWRRGLYFISYAPLLSGITYILYVKFKLRKAQHRAINVYDMHYIKRLDIDNPIMTMTDNPGIRIEEKFLSKDEQKRLKMDAKQLVYTYGYENIPYFAIPNFQKQAMYLNAKTVVNNIRVTGREPDGAHTRPATQEIDEELQAERDRLSKAKTASYEVNNPNVAPWNSANKFDINQLPNSFKDLINKIKKNSGMKFLSKYHINIVI